MQETNGVGGLVPAPTPASLAGQGHPASKIRYSQDYHPGLLAHGPMFFPLKPATSHDLQLAVNHVTKVTVALDVEIITAVSTPPTCKALDNLKDPFIIMISHGPR